MRQCFVSLLLVFHALPAAAQDATTPGELSTPHPTLEHLSIEWEIAGDDNNDGVVAVRFRESGAATWRSGLPLLRVPAGSNAGHAWSNRHAGTLFGLTPATTYEVETTLTDPDGGTETRMVSATTRGVPTVPAGAATINVTPATFADAISDASAGDVIVLGAGTYPSFTVTADGAVGSPIVVRGESAASVIIDGEVRMDGRSDVWIMDLTVRGQVKFNSSSRMVVTGCHIETDRDGIVAFGSGTVDGYFADNTVVGPTVWREAALGVSGDNLGEGIALTGAGNVIAHNRVQAFRDCVSLLEDGDAIDQRSIDIIGNDLFECADDAIEADFSAGNVRVLRNRSASTFIAWSSQPSLGGPTYFIRNVAFGNFFQVFKPNRSSLGDVLYHNTVLVPGDAFGVYTGDAWGGATARNNLFIGGAGEAMALGYSTGPGSILVVPSLDTRTSSFDYDGYGSIEVGRFDGRFGDQRFSSFAELVSMTSETHAVQVDLSVFESAVDHPRALFPSVAAPDLRLAAGSAAVDVGLPLPNINDGFSGPAPDLGAYELGSALPPYGPRTGAAVCGNGAVEAGETCDDGNTTGGDGCSAMCRLETTTDDGGVATLDGGASDGGAMVDGGDPADAGTAGPETDGCSCRVGGGSTRGGWLLGLALLIWASRRRWRAVGGASSTGMR